MPEDRKEQSAKYYSNNREKVKKKSVNYRKDNPEKIRKYCEDNKEKLNAYSLQYRKDNKEMLRKKQQDYYYANKDAINERARKREAIKKKNTYV